MSACICFSSRCSQGYTILHVHMYAHVHTDIRVHTCTLSYWILSCTCTWLKPHPQALCAFYAGEPGTFSHMIYIVTYIIVRGQNRSKDSGTSLPFAGDSVSALSLWYKWALKSSYKKCRFIAFLRCLRTAAVLAHARFTGTRPTAS